MLESLTEEFDEISFAEEETGAVPLEQGREGEEPSICDPEWHRFVMSHFTPEEMDESGHPFVAGLRRVARLLLGPILHSGCRVIQPPTTAESGRILNPTTIEYEIRFLWCRDTEGAAYPVTFVAAADVFWGNTDLNYVRFPTATAETRAEGRCLRKALQLQKVMASEEGTLVPAEEAAIDGMIVPSQILFIDMLCRRLDVNVMSYVNSGKRKYDSIQRVPYHIADKMTEHLSGLQTDPKKITDDIKGYDSHWKGDN